MNHPYVRLVVSDINQSLNFYVKILGFKIVEKDSEKRILIQLNKTRFLLHQTDMAWSTTKLSYPYGVGIIFFITVKSLNKIYKNVRKTNYPLYSEYYADAYDQEPTLSNEQQIIIQDPDGYLLTISLK